ncbi:translation initiation factor IF-2 [Parasediminibacterium sp. JCM 36343]|uniref:translation initiation factor IF-2 n=1 Tax=Parasediminibacterium sp. JCM 36343 TaxID=3374279 RepID=UPI00397A27F5
MSELKLPRLLAAATEFNVGQDTLVDFLAKKGFNKDDLKPATKLTEQMYYALQAEFHSDKQAKNKADLVEIPKSQQTERKKRDEEEITFRREDKKAEPKPAEVVNVPAEQPAAPVIFAIAPPIVAGPVIVAPAPPPPPAPVEVQKVEAVVMPTVFEPVKEAEPSPSAIVAETAPLITKIDAPELEGPKILDKIDLSSIDSSTRPRKSFTKKDESNEDIDNNTSTPVVTNIPVTPTSVWPVAVDSVAIPVVNNTPVPPASVAVNEVENPIQPILPVAEAVVAKIVTTIVPSTPVVEVAELSTAKEDDAPIIENIQAEKLTGPKILGKIELPVDSDTRPKQLSAEERKKRKRIPVDNRRVGGGHPHHNQPNVNVQGGGNFQNRGSQQPNTGGGFNRDNRTAPHQQTPAAPSTTGNSRPIVPANNRGGGFQGSGGGGFNRDNRGGGGGRSGGAQGGGGFNRGGTSGNRPAIRRDDKEIDAKEIQDKIKETQAKLAGGGGRGKSLKAKYRRAKREEAAEAMGDGEGDDNKLQVTEFVTVSELANLMDVSFADVIGKCMGLGIMVSINQRLDAEVIELVASEFDFEVEFIGVDDIDEMDEEEEEEDAAASETRPPIVTIMGHVDHGKTSLLDYIRSANVVAGEAGGITQHIGAYEVTLPNGKAITFLDTPGHEAFTAMRARGAKVTDVAVIVVAADDAVMPQTKEAISHAQAAGVPMIFAVNKIDKDGANPQKIYEQLAGMNILVESWGGKFQSQELSAKKGENVDLLLEKILLEAELLDVKANPTKEATGSIIEASLDKGRGYVATLLVQNGTLRQGDLMVSGQYYGRVKAMFNERNQRVEEAPPSTPVVILGLNGAPQAGEKFKIYTDESEAKDIATKRAQISREQGLRARKHITLDEIGRRLALGNFKELNIIIKGDVDGSVEALSDSLQKLSNQEIAIRIVHKAVGQISESDILLAAASDAIIVGFNVRPSSQANKLADNEGVQVKMYSIIYTAIDEIRSAMEGMLEPKVEEKEVATVEIREVYKFDKITVAGCYVQEGKVKRDHKIRVFRDGILVYPRQEGGFAELGSLKRFKDDVKEVNNGYECGLTVKGFIDLNANDTIIAYEEEEVKRTL